MAEFQLPRASLCDEIHSRGSSIDEFTGGIPPLPREFQLIQVTGQVILPLLSAECLAHTSVVISTFLCRALKNNAHTGRFMLSEIQKRWPRQSARKQHCCPSLLTDILPYLDRMQIGVLSASIWAFLVQLIRSETALVAESALMIVGSPSWWQCLSKTPFSHVRSYFEAALQVRETARNDKVKLPAERGVQKLQVH
jgi:hypothetical protein